MKYVEKVLKDRRVSVTTERIIDAVDVVLLPKISELDQASLGELLICKPERGYKRRILEEILTGFLN